VTRFILIALALLLVLRLVLRFVFGLFQGLADPAGTQAGSGGARPGHGAKIAGALVRDPICGMYIPREGAVTAAIGGETRYYCSEACRVKDAAAGHRQAELGRAAHG
jgi:hypothetical protein